MKIGKYIIILMASLAFASAASAQIAAERKDSLVYRQAAALDSSLVGKNILSMMPSKAKGGMADVRIHQSQNILTALEKHIAGNPSRTITGYRVRIYFDNAQNARTASEETLERFLSRYHGVPAYRSYQSPFFKVTVGDFRTRSEALELLERIKGEFPTAFILKENINYPVIDKNRSFVVDTIRVSRVKEI